MPVRKMQLFAPIFFTHNATVISNITHMRIVYTHFSSIGIGVTILFLYSYSSKGCPLHELLHPECSSTTKHQ